jgi:GH25 family lysozyme M1 (1,4-beta-N-acetylmuramidase)
MKRRADRETMDEVVRELMGYNVGAFGERPYIFLYFPFHKNRTTASVNTYSYAR